MNHARLDDRRACADPAFSPDSQSKAARCRADRAQRRISPTHAQSRRYRISSAHARPNLELVSLRLPRLSTVLFVSGRWFGAPREKQYERYVKSLLYSLAGIVTFLLMNIKIADYLSIGPTLTFSFSGNFARDMTYTIAWAVLHSLYS